MSADHQGLCTLVPKLAFHWKIKQVKMLKTLTEIYANGVLRKLLQC